MAIKYYSYQQQQQQEEQEWSPFVGPRPFERDSEEQKLFFGRNYESEKIISLIYGHKLVLVYAQSGADKTSIFNGRIIPALEQRGLQVLPLARVGFGSGYTAIDRTSIGDGSSIKEINPYIFNTIQSLAPDLNDPLLKINSLSEFLCVYFPHQLNHRGKPNAQVIIFDQLEELFNFYSDPDKWHEQQVDFLCRLLMH